MSVENWNYQGAVVPYPTSPLPMPTLPIGVVGASLGPIALNQSNGSLLDRWWHVQVISGNIVIRGTIGD